MYSDTLKFFLWWAYIDGLVQDYSVSSALAMETLQFCPKTSIYAEHHAFNRKLDVTAPAVFLVIELIHPVMETDELCAMLFILNETVYFPNPLIFNH